jgi:stress response protein YsnF
VSENKPPHPEKQGVTLPVAAEQASVTAVPRVTGTVRVDLRTETVEELVAASLTRSEAAVERREVDRMLASGEELPRIRTEDGVTIVPILEERLVVEIRSFLKAELHITTNTLSEDVATPVTLRRQTVEVTRTSAPDQAQPGPISSQPGEN